MLFCEVYDVVDVTAAQIFFRFDWSCNFMLRDGCLTYKRLIPLLRIVKGRPQISCYDKVQYTKYNYDVYLTRKHYSYAQTFFLHWIVYYLSLLD